jgi:hypothetical protein
VEADLFLVEGREDWCTSLRAPQINARTVAVRVQVERVDDVLEELGVTRVDFIKLDVEGAELSFLQGARTTLALSRASYSWFALTANNNLQPISTHLKSYDANPVALPAERVGEIRKILLEAKLREHATRWSRRRA